MKTSKTSEWLDGGDLLKEKPKPIDWFLEDILPIGAVGDVFSPPGAGKSTLLTSLMLAVAGSKRQWFGKRCVSGGVLALGGEKSSRDVWVRDLHRAAGTEMFDIEPGRLMIAPPTIGPLFVWDARAKVWQRGRGYDPAVQQAIVIRPALTIIDTIGRAAAGQDPISIPQQQALAEEFEDLGREIGGTLLTVSHTSQASGSEDVQQRLHYTSRAGSNGIPGHLRWLMGMTLLTPKEVSELTPIPADEVGRRQMIAVAVSKHSEMPQPAGWNRFDPSIFEMMPDGSVMAIPKYLKEYRVVPPPKSRRGLGNLVGKGAQEYDKQNKQSNGDGDARSPAGQTKDEDLAWLK
jgi:hypothetical protein